MLLNTPACTDAERWRAAWDLLATCHPLYRSRMETEESFRPTAPLFDALMDLHNRRPAIEVCRTPQASTGFHVELLTACGIPSLPPR